MIIRCLFHVKVKVEKIARMGGKEDELFDHTGNII